MSKKRYEFLEGVTLADIAFKAYGETLEALFENAALAVFEVMVATKKVALKNKWEISLENMKVDNLLYDFLAELLALKDEAAVVFGKFEVKINKNDRYKLKALVYGDTIESGKYELGTDVKAVTMHKFGVEKTRTGYQATVVLDV